MNRRAFFAVLGMGCLTLAVPLALPAFAKDSGSGDSHDSGSNTTVVKSSTTDQPGTEAQPQAATQCAAGTDCKKK